jgi:hypothetical protein
MQFATYGGLLFWHYFTKRIGKINACIPKETTRKFSEWLCLSVSVLPRKELKDAFHCFTLHFNSLNIMSQQMHIYIIEH